MKTTLWMLLSMFLLTGCAAVQEAVHVVVSDPNVQSAVSAVLPAVTTAIVLSKPELVAVITSGVAAVGAVTALFKAFKKVK